MKILNYYYLGFSFKQGSGFCCQHIKTYVSVEVTYVAYGGVFDGKSQSLMLFLDTFQTLESDLVEIP